MKFIVEFSCKNTETLRKESTSRAVNGETATEVYATAMLDYVQSNPYPTFIEHKIKVLGD
jgi:hypothetical protein